MTINKNNVHNMHATLSWQRVGVLTGMLVAFLMPLFVTFAEEIPAEPAALREFRLQQEQFKRELEAIRQERRTDREDIVEEVREENARIREENKALLENPLKNRDTLRENRAQIQENRGGARADLKESREQSAAEKKALLEARMKTQKDALEAKKEQRKKAIEAKKEQLEERREDRKEVLEVRLKENVERHLKKTIERFEAAIERLHNLATRIESRIASLKEDGVDVAEAERSLDQARTLIALAENTLSSASVQSVEITEGEAPGQTYKQVQEGFKTTKDALKDAHRALVDVVSLLKGSSSTSTPQSETNQ